MKRWFGSELVATALGLGGKPKNRITPEEMKGATYCPRCDFAHDGPCATRREIEPAFLIWLFVLVAIVIGVRLLG